MPIRSRPSRRPALRRAGVRGARAVGRALLVAFAGWTAALGAGEVAWQAGEGFRFAAVEPAADGRAGFTSLPAPALGILFTNRLSVAEAAFNNNLMAGSGVAAGDFDGDGWCDVYFCAIGGTNALYRNLGDWRFEEVTATGGVGLPGRRSTGAVWADVDGDGRLDLLVATLGQGVHCFRNEGAGRFRDITSEVGLASKAGSTSLALADVDGDGDLDLYVTNYGAMSVLRSGSRPDVQFVNGQWVVTGPYADRFRTVDGRLEEVGEPDGLYLNDGRGRFQAVPWDSPAFLDEQGRPKPEPWDYGLTVQMRDLDGDRAPEIYVCNDFQTVDRFWLNDGHGRFRLLPRLAMRKQSFSSMGVDFADLDRDGALDFFVTEMMSREHRLRLRQVVGMEPSMSPPGYLEGRPEVARNTLFRNRGDGTYVELANYSGVSATDWSWLPVFLDVDLDGYEDLLIGNGMLFDVQNRDVLNHVRSLGPQPPESARTNLALYPPFLSPNLAFRNRHDFTFEDVSRAWGFDSTRISHSVALADFDRDGDLDLAINCLNAAPLLLRNDSPAPRLAVRLRGRPPNPYGIGAQIRVSGGPAPTQIQEILCGGRYLAGDDAVRVFAAGALSNRLTLEVRWRGGHNSVVTNARPNRVYEIDEAGAPPAPPTPTPPQAPRWFRDVSAQLGHAHREELFNDFTRQPLLMKLLSQLGPGAAWVDLDGDGHDELALGTGRGGVPAVYRRAAAGGFTPIPVALPGPMPDDLLGLAAWSTADGRPCLLAGLARYESEATNAPPPFALFFLGPGGVLRQVGLTDVPAVRDSTGPVAVADLDGDGDLDVFLGGRVVPGAYPEPASSRILRQEGGRLVNDTLNTPQLEQVGLVSGAMWSDLDADGYPELVLACEWGPIRVFANARGQLRDITAPLGLAAFPGWWNGVAAADLDEDGRLDLVAANWGLNTGYEASPAHPLRLYYGELGGQGAVDLIESYYVPDLDAEAPRRTLDALSRAFPFLAEHYPTHAAFSTATLPDLLRRLPGPVPSVAATELRSMVFLNRGTNFVARPLPAEAQFAPAFAVNVGDLDGDSHEDVFLSQNFFALRPEWPRLDGGRGLCLRGNGRGELTPLPGQESGVAVYGEQRGAALGDFNEDGRIDLVVTQNGAATRLFENAGARPGLRVRLQGPRGNPAGLGAILRLQRGEWLGPAREIRAGSGYGSQDSVVQVLALPEPPSSSTPRPPALAPARLHVLWPGGARTVSEIPPGAGSLVVDVRGRATIAAPNP